MTEFNTPKHYVLAEGSDSMDALEKILGSEYMNTCHDLLMLNQMIERLQRWKNEFI